MAKLYEIADEIEEILSLPEGSDEFDEAVFHELKMDFEAKLEAIACVIRNKQADSKKLAEHLSEVTKSKKALDRDVEGLKNYVKKHMEQLNITRLQAGMHKFAIQRNSAMSVEVLDWNKLDEEWKKVKWEPRLSAIADHVKETGEEPEGTRVTRGTHLRIR